MDIKTRQFIFTRDSYLCQNCFDKGSEVAHRISQGKTGQLFVKNYLLENYNVDLKLSTIKNKFIDHPFNAVLSCRTCNDIFNALNNPQEAIDIIESIVTYFKFWDMELKELK